MQIIGRITADGVLKEYEGRKFWSFDIAENFNYKQKDGSVKEFVTFYNCTYWSGNDLAKILKKGAMFIVEGRAEARTWMSETEGKPKAAINVYVERLKLLVMPVKTENNSMVAENPVENFSIQADEDALPF